MLRLNFFNFKKFGDKVLITNDLGRYSFLTNSEFRDLISHKLDRQSNAFKELEDKGFLFDGNNLEYTQKYRWDLLNTKGYLGSATSLHIFVVTTACNVRCVYCQANNGSSTPNCFMDVETAERAVDIALQSPERYLNFEFQGGEPLLNFDIIRHIVEYTEANNVSHDIDYSVVSNLTLLKDEMIEFFKEHHFSISTSVDGDKSVHDKNRPFANKEGTFDIVREKIKKLKMDNLDVGAIETTTRDTLNHPDELIDTYRDLSLRTVFIRPLTQLGKAAVSWGTIGYTSADFLEFYKKTVNKLIDINKRGYFIQEQHASIFLRKIRGDRINYMELRSPCGGGIGQLAYFADGRIFTCDEGRMLAEMGYDSFLLGNVYNDNYKSLISNSSCKAVCASSLLETIPSCCDCVYQPYCGTCPVVSYSNTGDILEKEPRSFRCEVYKGILDYLFGLLKEGNKETLAVLDSWSN